MATVMVSLSRTKSVTLFLVVCYILAVTVSGLFHNHDNNGESCCPVPPQAISGETLSGDAPSACGCQGHHHHSAEPTQTKQKTEGKDHSTGEPHITGSPEYSGWCPICSFLAQKTVTSEIPPAIVWTTLDKACDPKLPLAPFLLSPYSWHGRAPPLVA